ncbi:MAG: PEP-CTERM sorting domain-containing protein [Isosphaeraceae bacterium]|nr:PEP-CTERM sorting domain-containing protein [Isosphaeraceae bacterium]
MLRIIALSALALILVAGNIHAGTVDPTGDFLGTYAGPQNGDMDITEVDATFDGSTFVLTSKFAGSIGTTVGGRYIWGVNRGAGTAGFGVSLGRTGVLFDAVIAINNTGTGTAAGAALPAANIVISGNMLTVRVPASMLTSTGFAASAYTFNLWPRSPGSGTTFIPDFAPDNSNIAARAVPEPASIASAVLGASAGLAFLVRRRTRA